MRVLHLPEPVRAEIETWVRGGYPFETCGLLLGSHDDTQSQVLAVTQARNLNQARASDRYELDPQDFLAADKAARDAGMEVIGVWHSHPDHPAFPSETDREAAWAGWSYVIAAVTREGVRAMTSWRLDEERQFIEELVER